MDKFTLLKILDASHNHMKKVPISLGSVKSLTRLVLASNQLVEIPNALWNLPKLELLDLSGNKIARLSIEEKKGSCSMPKLKILDLSANKLQELPDALGNLSALNNLNISSNELARIPESFGNLKSIRSIDAKKNKFNDENCIPESLLADTQLFHLVLEGNPIAEGQAYYKLKGFDKYEKRCKEKGDKQIQGGLGVTLA